jgi:flagellar basal body-associated protein FliL
MPHNISRSKESGIVILALFVLIIIAVVIAAFFFVMQKQRKADGKDTQINIQSTINL